ncbi:MAG: TetR/AcrR family transcriptional regulator [Bacillota bacterium]|nr:TetR/AcrR family transcriptional regulator [Bacillota bacterium]
MNTPNNKRRKDSQRRIETAFVKLLQNRELKQITVTDICKSAGVNRTTFYTNYLNIYDLADAVQKRLENEVFDLYQEEREQKYNSNDFLKLFYHIKENQLFYKTYFKLGLDGRFQITEYDVYQAAAYYDNRYIEYHMEFFRNGLNAVIKRWLHSGCKESPEEIFSIISEEYMGKK